MIAVPSGLTKMGLPTAEAASARRGQRVHKRAIKAEEDLLANDRKAHARELRL
jgi:hypothetical protein